MDGFDLINKLLEEMYSTNTITLDTMNGEETFTMIEPNIMDIIKLADFVDFEMSLNFDSAAYILETFILEIDSGRDFLHEYGFDTIMELLNFFSEQLNYII